MCPAHGCAKYFHRWYGGNADAGQGAEAAPPTVAAHEGGRPGVGDEWEGTRFSRATYPEGPCWTEVAVQLGVVAARAPPQLDRFAGRGHHPRAAWTRGVHELVPLRFELSLRKYPGHLALDRGYDNGDAVVDLAISVSNHHSHRRAAAEVSTLRRDAGIGGQALAWPGDHSRRNGPGVPRQ